MFQTRRQWWFEALRATARNELPVNSGGLWHSWAPGHATASVCNTEERESQGEIALQKVQKQAQIQNWVPRVEPTEI